jgi:hypothetical protein
LIATKAQGRLRTDREFGDVVMKTGSNAKVVRLSYVVDLTDDSHDVILGQELVDDSVRHFGTTLVVIRANVERQSCKQPRADELWRAGQLSRH